MSESANGERAQAIFGGLEFIYRTAREPENFGLYGHDYLFCLDCIASTARDARLRGLAKTMGRERARRWRREHAVVGDDTDADGVAGLTMGAGSAERLGVVDRAFRARVQKAAARFGGRDYYGFDPWNEPPPEDVPETCVCGAKNPRGRRTCRDCRKRLSMLGRYGAWLDALIVTYFGDRYGVTLGAPYREVIKWLPVMRPYEGFASDEYEDYWTACAVTHVVYTLNDYGLCRLSPRRLAEEFEFLKRSLKDTIAQGDAEMVGEIVDALKAFGLADRNPLIREGRDFLLSRQNADGSWGDVEADDIYLRYHPTFTAILGLFEHKWRGECPRLRELRPLFANTRRGLAPL